MEVKLGVPFLTFFFVFVVKKSPFLHRPDPHKKVYRDLTEKKQDLTEMSIILMVLTEILS